MLYCFPSVHDLAEKISEDFLQFLAEALTIKETIHIAVSGGSTPRAFFEQTAANQTQRKKPVPWNKVHFFWVDERCVPPDHADSNYGMIYNSLLRKINVNEQNIHRILGENDPRHEADRYAEEIEKFVESQDGVPIFDLVLLGIGDDGHTASIFPDRMDLLRAEKTCVAVKHPVSGKFRVTLTGRPILQAKKIAFLVTGNSKSRVIKHILDDDQEASFYPATLINRMHNHTDWYLDKEAAKLLNITHCGKY